MTESNDVIIEQFEKLIEQIKHDIDTAKDKKEALKHSFRLSQTKNL